MHQMKIEDYFASYIGLSRPVCACNQCKQLVNIAIKGASIYWKKYQCGRYPETIEWSKKAKKSRIGPGNPMYGKRAWNTGMSKDDNPILFRMAQKAKGRKASVEQKLHMSQAAKKRKIHGHTGHKHSEATKQKLRENTLRLIKMGIFKQTRSKPHLKMCEILESLNILYIEEKIIKYFSFDFYLPDYNLYLEVDGDYFHSNPRSYPDGPKTKTQKVNYTRDIAKNNFCRKKNLKLMRFWEYDILKGTEAISEKLLCILKK